MHLEKTVLVITSEYYPIPAAAASRTIPLVSELRKFYSKVLVLTSKDAFEHKDHVERSFFSVPDNRCNIFHRFLQELLLGLDLGLRIWLKRNVHLCIITSPPFFMACCCAFFAKVSRKEYIFDVRDRYPRVLYDLGVLKKKSFIYKILKGLESWIYRGACIVSTVTEGLHNDLINEFPKIKFSLLKNGFDEETFSKKLTETKKLSNFTIVYHGRLGRFYDTNAYLEIIEKVQSLDSDIRFLLIGNLPTRLHSLTCHNVRILPAMSLEDLSHRISACHLGLCLLKDLPAMKNAFPVKSYEFIGAGLPQLVGPFGELSKSISKLGMGVSFEKINPSQIAHSIVELKKDPTKLIEMRKNVLTNRDLFGRKHFIESFFKSNNFLN